MKHQLSTMQPVNGLGIVLRHYIPNYIPNLSILLNLDNLFIASVNKTITSPEQHFQRCLPDFIHSGCVHLCKLN